MTTEYVVLRSGCWSGQDMYTLKHDDRLFFSRRGFHSEEHVKREAVEYLQAFGYEAELENIVIKSDGTL